MIGGYSSVELGRLRFGPISTKERTRSVAERLTVESNPGHGAYLKRAVCEAAHSINTPLHWDLE